MISSQLRPRSKSAELMNAFQTFTGVFSDYFKNMLAGKKK
jgi:hypothetical protein